MQIPLGIVFSLVVGLLAMIGDLAGDPGEFVGFCVAMAGLYFVYRVYRYWHWRWFIVGAIGAPLLIGLGAFLYTMMMLGGLAGGMGR